MKANLLPLRTYFIWMDRITVHGRNFRKYINHASILEAVSGVAQKINQDYAGRRPLFLSVLNGSFMFTSDLLKGIDLECELSFIRLASYEGTDSTGTVRSLLNVGKEVAGRDLIILEDIIDTGNTVDFLLHHLEQFEAASISLATLLFKPEAYKKQHAVKYVGIEVPNDFLLGYGLDYDGLARNLPDIYVLAE